MAFGLDPTAALVVGANRDERLDRRALPMTVLNQKDPLILGGIDLEAGGTWLAVNSSGLVVGLTNRPLPDGRDPTRRTRGEIPLALAHHRSAPEAVEDFVQNFSPSDYNPAWFLIGDRTSLYSVDFTSGDSPRPVLLPPGLHILENNSLGSPSPKVDHVLSLLATTGSDLMKRLPRVLADHDVPADRDIPDDLTPPAAASGSSSPGRRPETLAACVHTDDYGTRSSTLIRVPSEEELLPEVFYTDGHPCTSPFIDASPLWGQDEKGSQRFVPG
jgi:uncharacterized protein with NRDE domain